VRSRFDRAVLLDDLLRALLADAGRARYVVDGVAPQAEQFDDLTRRTPIFSSTLLASSIFISPVRSVRRIFT